MHSIKLKSKLILLYTALLIVFASCRTEESELIEPPSEEVITSSSALTSLMKRTVTKDGSGDNILDKANCITIKLPVDVTVNSKRIRVTSKEDYKKIEHVLDDSDDDMDAIEMTYPIIITFEDFSEAIVSSERELQALSSNCKGENVEDDDIECLDFKYPFKAFLFNSNNEAIESITLNSDNDLYSFLDNLSPFDLVTMEFPLFVNLKDDTEITINNLQELGSTINAYAGYCDEDDDYDYNDDDCDDCTTEQLLSALTSCGDWQVDKLERYGRDYDNYYDGYIFNFYNNGSISVYYNNAMDYGTWVANGSGNEMTVTINVPNLPYCNNDWRLHEISQYSDTKIDFRVGDNDRLRYENDCN